MDESRFLKLRQEMEENNMEVRDFLDDFGRWKADVDKKHAKLSSEAKTSDILLPPIRNILTKKKKKKKPKKGDCLVSEASETKKPNRIRSCDYKAWDQFDVEKAILDVDKPEEKAEPEESETDEEWEEERRLKLSELEKEQGNLVFKQGKFADSIEHYTTAIRLAPENPLLYTNRALALFKLERFASAESDCSTALMIDPKLVKALYRRAQARKQLDKIEDAICDLRRILDQEPCNSAALKDLRAWTGDADLKAGSINSLFKLVDSAKLDERRKEELKMRRIPISEVGRSKLVNGISSIATPRGDTPQDQKKPIISETFDIASSRLKEQLPQEKRQNNFNKTEAPIVPSPTVMPQILNPVTSRGSPTNWFQMDRELRELCDGSSSQLTPLAIDYICSIQPDKYASIIGSNLDYDCLSRMIYAITDSSSSVLDIQDQVTRLFALSKLPRFDVAWMLVDEDVRTAAAKLIGEVLDGNQRAELSKVFS